MGNVETPEWVKPGATVWLSSRAGWGPETAVKRTIGKVHKTGRFVLDGGTSQFSCRYGNESASTRSEWSHDIVYPDTPENRARFERAAAVIKATAALHAEADRLSKVARSRDDDAILAEATRLAPQETRHD